jgi:hypothetical protein
MEEKISLNGKFLIKKDFTRAELAAIRDEIIRGTPEGLICRKFDITENVLNNIYGNFKEIMAAVNAGMPKCILGSKTEAYFSEEQMLAELPKYSWKDLSRVEKQFYFNYGKKFNKVRAGISRRLEPHLRVAYERGKRVSCTSKSRSVSESN